MARTGQTLVNPVSGERITFRTTAEESTGNSSQSSSRSPRAPVFPAGSTSTRYRRSASR